MTSDALLSITRIQGDDDDDDEPDGDADGSDDQLLKITMLRGRTRAELATAEEALRSAVPTVALCNGRLPTFLRAMYARVPHSPTNQQRRGLRLVSASSCAICTRMNGRASNWLALHGPTLYSTVLHCTLV